MKLTVVLLCLVVLIAADHSWDVDDLVKAAVVHGKSQLYKQSRGQQHQRRDSLGPSAVIGTLQGDVQGGLYKTDRDGVTFAAYTGIPFGKPPVGLLRFKAPLPAEPWIGILNTTKESPSCIGFGIQSGEDCLYLNVYTPVLDPSTNQAPRAVMVFIYGGGFQFGNNSPLLYNPQFLIDQDVLVVAANYRLDALGFLSLQNEEVPGNAGLKDQLLALKWVKANIQNFGGDVERITVFGESAGSGSTGYMQLIKEAHGLYNGLIMESGSVYNSWTMSPQESVVPAAFNLGSALGCEFNQTEPGSLEALHQCLLEVPAVELGMQGEVLTALENGQMATFFPVIEPDVSGAILTKSPVELIESGDFNHVNVIIGVNSLESLLIQPILDFIDPYGLLTIVFGADLRKFIPNDLRQSLTEEQQQEVADQIRDVYFDGQDVTLAQRHHLMQAMSDDMFLMDIQKATLAIATHSNATTYNYRFGYEGPFNILKRILGVMDEPGVCHFDEIGYLFSDILFDLVYDDYPRNSTPQITIDRMTQMWTNFAKTGNPTPVLDDEIITTQWKPITTNNYYYFDINEQLTLKEGMEAERLMFWNDVYEKYQNKRPFPV